MKRLRLIRPWRLRAQRQRVIEERMEVMGPELTPAANSFDFHREAGPDGETPGTQIEELYWTRRAPEAQEISRCSSTREGVLQVWHGMRGTGHSPEATVRTPQA